jgi:hypothetical protein
MKNVVEIMNFIYLLYPLKYLSVLSPQSLQPILVEERLQVTMMIDTFMIPLRVQITSIILVLSSSSRHELGMFEFLS